jgi:hypothetical protein
MGNVTNFLRTGILISCFLISTVVRAQTFRNAFDAFDNINAQFSNNPGAGSSMLANANIDITSDAGFLTGYLNMFKVTKDQKYMDRFAIHAKRIMDRRDDNITNICGDPGSRVFGFPFTTVNAAGCNITGTNDILLWNTVNPGIPSKSWSRCAGSKDGCGYNIHETAQDATICYPMALFVYLISTDTDFQKLINLPVPSEVSQSGSSIITYGDLAFMLNFKLHETADWWTDPERFITAAPATFNNNQSRVGYINNDSKERTFGQVNMQAAMGCLLVLLEEISIVKSPYAIYPPGIYDHYLSNVISDVKFELTPGPCQPFTIFWFTNYNHTNQEDVGHAQATFQLANLCNKFKLPNGTNADFNITWMQEFAMTFATQMYISPLNFGLGIAQTGSFCPLIPDKADQTTNTPVVGPYAYLTEFNPYIYGIISDYYASNSLYSPAWNGVQPNDPGILGYSQLALVENTPDYLYSSYKNIFNPISVKRGSGQKWNGAAGGDYSGNGTYQIAAVTNSSNSINILTIDPMTKLQNLTGSGTTGVSSPVRSLFSGKLLGTMTGKDVIFAIGDSYDVDILQQNGSTLNSLLNSTSTFQVPFHISGAAVGDFDINNPGEEVLLADENENLFILEYLPGATQGSSNFKIISTGLNPQVGHLAGMTAGHFDGSTDMEFAIADNSGFVSVFKFSNSLTSISQLYTISVPSGASVDWNGMTSGDFLGLGNDQICAHSGYDGQFLLYQVDPSSSAIVLTAAQAFPDGDHMPDGTTYNTGNGFSSLNGFNAKQKWQAGLMTRLKSCPGSGTAALATLRNCDGQITIYDMEGACQGLSLSNDYFYDQTFTSNTPDAISPTPPANYIGISPTSNKLTGENSNSPTDYHVSRNLNAANDLVYPNTSVNFIAGNEVALTDGVGIISGANFGAYIDPSLSCSPARKLPHSKTGNSKGGQNSTSSLKTPFGGLAVEPNPSQGQFVAHTTDGTTGKIFVYDTRGQLVYSNADYSLNTWNLDLGSYPEGVYFVKVISNDGHVATQKVIHK